MISKKFLFCNTVIFCAWTGILSFLLYQTYWGTPFENSSLLQQHFKDRTLWYAVYTGDKKIGSAKVSFQEVGDEIIISKESMVNVEEEGIESSETVLERLKCLCNRDYSIKSFQYSMNTHDKEETAIEGRVENNLVLFFIEHKGKKHVRKVPTKGSEFYLPIILISVIHQQVPAPHVVFRTTLLDIVNTRLVDSRVMLEEIIPFKTGINIKSIYKYRIDDSFFWTDESGSVIKEQRPSDITLYAQPKSIALEAKERPIFDYTSLPLFKTNLLIPEPEEVTSMKIKIKGIALETLESVDNVTPLSAQTFVIHKMKREELEKGSYTLPNTDDSLQKYLAADDWVSSDNKQLSDTGRVYARAQKKDAFRLASYLTSYVKNLMFTVPQFALRNSTIIPEYLEGDYIEKSLMFATYARAGGLPTRLMGGLVYRNGYFFFHTWPEVWFGKWVPVDPSLYQFPADATHIPLVTGSMTDIISIIDNLKSINLEILEAS